jgi:Rrf2 family nitric oxide-sensitive transcriptional repressor
VRFKLQTDYALQALTYMACKAGGNCTTDEIAAYFQISSAHLGRVIRRLQRYGYVRALRGRRGGVRLARDPQSFTVGEVVNCLEEGAEPLDAMVTLAGTSPDAEFRLRAVVRRGHGSFLHYLDQVPFSELAVDGLPPAPAPRPEPEARPAASCAAPGISGAPARAPGLAPHRPSAAPAQPVHLRPQAPTPF